MEDNHNPLRGTEYGKFGWTESAKMHSTVKRLLAATDGNPNHKDKSKHETVACDKCGMSFSVRGDKLPKHRRNFTKSVFDEETKKYVTTNETEVCEGKLVRKGSVKLETYTVTTSKGVTIIKPGDTIMVETSHYNGKEIVREILTKTIKFIVEETTFTRLYYFSKKNSENNIKKQLIIKCTDGTDLNRNIRDICIIDPK